MTRRAAAAVRGLAATLTLAALVIALPLVLYRFGGNPVPHRILPAHQLAATLMRRDTGALFLAIVRDVSWLAWALFTMAVITETIAAASGRRAPRLRIGGLQGIAAQLVAVAAMTFSGPVSTVLAAATSSAPAVLTVNRAVPLAPVLGQGQVHLMARTTPTARAPAATEAATGSTRVSDHPAAGGQVMSMASFQAVVVHPGDCLWAIAQRYLGNGELFPQIAALNTGHEMGGGQVFRDPTLIRPGWVLQLPATGTPGTPGTPAAGHPSHPSAGTTTHPPHPSRHHHFNRPHPVATPAPDPTPSAPTPAPRPSGGRHAAPGQADSSATPPAAFTPAPGQGLHGGNGGSHSSGGTAISVTPAAHQREIPPLAVFGAGMLAGGIVASLSRMRHRQRQSRRPGRRIPMPASAPVLQAEQRLRTSPPLQPATALRAALAELGAGLAASRQQLADIAGIHLTSSAMELLLASPSSEPPPPPFTIPGGRQGMAWLLALPDHELSASVSPDDGDLLPGLLTAGAADGGGYLLVDLEHLRVTTVDGPPAMVSRVLATAAAELSTSELAGWYDLILVGYGELEVTGGRATVCESLDEALDMLAAKAVTLQRRLGDGGPADVRYRRVTEPDDEDWSLTLLVSKVAPGEAQLSFLTDIASEPGGIAALVAAPAPGPDGAGAHGSRVHGSDVYDSDAESSAEYGITEYGGAEPSRFMLAADPDRPDGIIARIFPLQLTVRPQTLSSSDYEAIVSLFETAAAPGDVSPDLPPYDGSAWTTAVTPTGGPDWDDPEPADDLAGPAPALAEPEPAPAPADVALASAEAAPAPADAAPGLTGPAWDETDPEWNAGRAEWDVPTAGDLSADSFATDSLTEDGFPGSLTAGRLTTASLVTDDGPALTGHPYPNGSGTGLHDGWPTAPAPLPEPASNGRHASSPPAPAASGVLRIGILGSFTVNGSAGALLPAQSQLILALALNGAVGLSNPQLGYLLGADPDHPKPSDSLRQLITRTRRQLGRTPDGREWIVHLGGGQYALHPDARFDWADFSDLAERGLAARDAAVLRDALSMVRGQPFTGCYHWWLDLAFVETVRAQVVDTADLLAGLELAAGNPTASGRAARAGLTGDVAAEQLWRALMRAEHATGNLSGVREAWSHCLAVIADIAPGGEPHPDTAALYAELLRRAPGQPAGAA